jgi:putative YpdA family bacillithiol system oxidoreductase
VIEQLVYGAGAAIAIVVILGYVLRYRSTTRQARQKLRHTQETGVAEPVSLHPEIDPNKCIGIGTCVDACPEGKIIGIVNGRFNLLSPNKCIGHGACLSACPVGAISLVFGTATRGVDIPHVKKTFETNVDGVFIAGELGGMGLIRNAVTQGKQAVENIAARTRSRDPSVLDVVIVGAGPAGLAASLEAEKSGLRFVCLEQYEIGGTILSYPRQKLVMTQPMEIPVYGKYSRREIMKEELLDLWHDVIQRTGVGIHTNERLENIVRNNGHFDVTTTTQQYAARQILLAIGRRGTPRKLGVPGEDTSKVTYKLLEPMQYRKKRVLVIGGGDSAIEAALRLSEQTGTEVTLSYRGSVFSRAKEKNREGVEQAMAAGRLNVMFGSEVERIEERNVTLLQNGNTHQLENDYVFVLIGGDLPTPLLKQIGIEINTKFGEQ